MNEFTTFDWAMLAVYLVGITWLGVRTSRHVKTSRDFFMPRRFGKWMMITFAFGTGTSSDQAVSVASRTMTNGLSAIWWQWLWLPATPFYWIVAPIMRRLRAVTTADVYALRYDRGVAGLYAVIGIVSLAAKIGLLLVGAGAMIDSCTNGQVPSSWAIAATTVLFVAYGTAGGLGAAVVTDFFQGLLIILFSFLLLPFLLNATGGLPGVRQTLLDHNDQMLSLVVPGRIDWFFVAMYALQALIGIVAAPFIMGVCGAGRTEMDGRVGFMFGNILKRICTMAWSLTSLAAVAWYLQHNIPLKTVEADKLYGNMAREFLPAAMPGLLGIFTACLLASITGSCSAVMTSASALFTENVYRPLVADRSDKHYLLVGRLTSLAVVAGGVAFAYRAPSVVDALNVWFKISPSIGIAFCLGLIWRRATSAGAWAATFASLAAWYASTLPATAEWIAQWPAAVANHIVWPVKDGGFEVAESWVTFFYLACGFAACILVSLVTRPTSPERLQLFYNLTRTPVQADEVVTAPCTLPVGVEPPHRRMLATAGGLEIPVPSATSVAGFVAGWIVVAAMVGGFTWLVKG